ncbi:unnamed protein product [Nesidiocoris tenuis]|uniref:Uncharacterized protein n=1 Tax=Nesidiocoris tenuis TaxID=355587 RepID=A0A6H5H0U0_9HEMI|nr:unnamed protein product [Nesidiocoris tenuis]
MTGFQRMSTVCNSMAPFNSCRSSNALAPFHRMDLEYRAILISILINHLMLNTLHVQQGCEGREENRIGALIRIAYISAGCLLQVHVPHVWINGSNIRGKGIAGCEKRTRSFIPAPRKFPSRSR